jgi:hypothetical protein
LRSGFFWLSVHVLHLLLLAAAAALLPGSCDTARNPSATCLPVERWQLQHLPLVMPQPYTCCLLLLLCCNCALCRRLQWATCLWRAGSCMLGRR